MAVKTSRDKSLPKGLFENYFRTLVNRFFKILPMRENGETSLYKYIDSLTNELLGCESLIPELRTDSSYLTLLAILEYLSSNKNCGLDTVKSEVFRAISICEKLEKQFSTKEV